MKFHSLWSQLWQKYKYLSICIRKKHSNTLSHCSFCLWLVTTSQKLKKNDVQNTIKLYLFNRLLKPILVGNVYESIHNGTEALMFPQRHHFAGIVDDFWGSVQHSLPDSAQVTQVEDVVELGGGGQHLDLDPLPHLPRGRHKGVNQFTDFLREFPPLLEQMVILFMVDFRVRFGTLLQSTLITKISNTF